MDFKVVFFNSKILPKIQPPVSHKGAFSSLPATPGRQLPKPNPNHRNARNARNNKIKRTNSADYGETDTYDNYYIRAGNWFNVNLELTDPDYF